MRHPRHTLQHTATHCNTLQHAATLCNTRQETARDLRHTRAAADTHSPLCDGTNQVMHPYTHITPMPPSRRMTLHRHHTLPRLINQSYTQWHKRGRGARRVTCVCLCVFLRVRGSESVSFCVSEGVSLCLSLSACVCV